MAKSRTTTVTVQGGPGGISLEDLRWLCAETEGMPSGSLVRIDKYNGDQRDPGYVTLTSNKVTSA